MEGDEGSNKPADAELGVSGQLVQHICVLLHSSRKFGKVFFGKKDFVAGGIPLTWKRKAV